MKLALSPNTAGRIFGGFLKTSVDAVSLQVGNKWGEARLKRLQITPLKKKKNNNKPKNSLKTVCRVKS